MKRRAKIGVGVALVFVLMQLVILPHDNPKVTGEIQAPPAVKDALHRACWDCHSNETVWPWYGRVAPASFLLYRDVVEGRRHLNFSQWSDLEPAKREKKQRRIAKEVESGDMPPWFYTPLHAQARLSADDQRLLADWSKGPVSP